MLVDLVSRAGNLLLDVGCAGDGRIPEIMQSRLVEMGDWLKVNGEAIYSTKTWSKPCQWSRGKKRDQEFKEYKSDYKLMESIGKPKEGKAVIEAFFTTKPGVLSCDHPRLAGRQTRLERRQANGQCHREDIGY